MRPDLRSLAAAVALLALAGCGGEPSRVEPPPASAAGERLTVAERAVADLKPIAAVVVTRNMGEARARIGGTLSRLAVREGDYVRKGQVVALVTDQRLAYETSAYAAGVAAAAAEAEQTAAALKRVRTLHEKGFYAAARLEEAEAAARAAQGRLDALRAQRSAAAELAGQGAVLAPTDGRVLHADVPAGSVVTPGQSLATITAGEPLLRVEIPEGQAGALRVGDAVRVVPEDLPGGVREGLITQVYPAVTAGRVVADIRAPGLDGGLVGRRVRVQVKVGERQALVIPRRFVTTRYGVDYVRITGSSGRIVETVVQLTPGPDPDLVEVLSGLQAGDVLIAPPRDLAQGPAR